MDAAKTKVGRSLPFDRSVVKESHCSYIFGSTSQASSEWCALKTVRGLRGARVAGGDPGTTRCLEERHVAMYRELVGLHGLWLHMRGAAAFGSTAFGVLGFAFCGYGFSGQCKPREIWKAS